MKRKIITNIILSLFLTLFIIIGLSFEIYSNLSLFTKNYCLILMLIPPLFFTIIKTINFLFTKLDNYKSPNINIKNQKIQKLYYLLNKKTFKVSFITMIICWSIYLIAFYPAILSPDPSHQILQFFNIDNKYSYYSILLDNNVIITNHHPVIHTLLLGFCIKIGLIFNNTNLGLFIYTIIQTGILAATLSYTVCFVKKLNLNNTYLLILLGIYSLTPVFPFYALSPVKDVIFTCLIIIYIIFIYNYIKTKNKLNFIKTLILLILITLFRNNGFHIIILSLPFLLFTNKNRIKIVCLVLAITTFYLSYHKIILPHFHITETSPREALSIPFQQTARYVKYHNQEITNKEKESIDKILNYKTLISRYNPEKADNVKNEYNKYATKKDLNNYFKTWYLELKKHPKTYLEATLNNTYGYFTPLKTNWYIYSKYNPVLKDHDFNYHYNSLNTLRTILTCLAIAFPYIPFIGLIINIGFSTWVLLFILSYLIYKRKYQEVIIYIPMIIILLVCIASPVNTYFRYAMPNIFVMPTILAIFINFIKEEGVK